MRTLRRVAYKRSVLQVYEQARLSRGGIGEGEGGTRREVGLLDDSLSSRDLLASVGTPASCRSDGHRADASGGTEADEPSSRNSSLHGRPLLSLASCASQTTAKPVAEASAQRLILVVYLWFDRGLREGVGGVVLRNSGTFQRRRESALWKKLQLVCPSEGLGTILGVELAVDVACVGLDRAYGHEEFASDLRVGAARGQKCQHLQLASA